MNPYLGSTRSRHVSSSVGAEHLPSSTVSNAASPCISATACATRMVVLLFIWTLDKPRSGKRISFASVERNYFLFIELSDPPRPQATAIEATKYLSRGRHRETWSEGYKVRKTEEAPYKNNASARVTGKTGRDGAQTRCVIRSLRAPRLTASNTPSHPTVFTYLVRGEGCETWRTTGCSASLLRAAPGVVVYTVHIRSPRVVEINTETTAWRHISAARKDGPPCRAQNQENL